MLTIGTHWRACSSLDCHFKHLLLNEARAPEFQYLSGRPISKWDYLRDAGKEFKRVAMGGRLYLDLSVF